MPEHSERGERRRQILDAISKLGTSADAPIDLAVDRIEWMLDQEASVIEVSPPTPKNAAKELDRVAAALVEIKAAFQGLSNAAREALNDAKFRRQIEWLPTHSKWSFMQPLAFSDFLELNFPQLQEAAEDAASNLRDAATAGIRPKRQRQYPLALSVMLAQFFEVLTDGERPGKGRGDSRFALFVDAIFVAGGISASASHYAGLAAEVHERRRKGENPPEIWWYHS